MNGGTLVAGPYLGEFGWEVGCWNPRIRRLALDFERTVVLTRAECAPLYEFAARVVPVEVVPGSSNYVHGTLARPAPEIAGDFHVTPTRELVRAEHLAFADPAIDPHAAGKCWHLFGTWRRPAPADVCLALRPPKLSGTTLDERKAYPEARALELAELLVGVGYRLACIGGPDNRTVPGALDLRGAPLAVQMDALSNALVCVGPSSGPMHLAQMCGCAVVTWYDATPAAVVSSVARYTRTWNPWGAPVRHLGGLPTPQAACMATMQLADRVEQLRSQELAG